MSDSVEIKIDGPRLTPDRFQKAVRDFFALLEGVEKNMTGAASEEDWIVEVDSGSVVIRAKAENPNAMQAINVVRNGFQSLEAGIQSAPGYFTRDEIRAARSLAALPDEAGRYIKEISIKNGAVPLRLSRQSVKTADAILAGESQIAFGSFEGFIETFHHKEGQPFTCSINDPVYKRKIVCNFTNTAAEEEAYRAFRPPRRVLASGLIHYAKEGHPVRIDVNLIRVFPEERELPTIEEVRGIYNR